MKILTFNIWGAPYAKDRSERTAAICEEVMRLNPDILLFQEVYLPNNRQQLLDGLSERWCYTHHFSSALLGSGLLTMSKYPIVDAMFQSFRMRGKPEDIMRGDYYAGKGIGLTRINTPDGVIDVYNCHTHAQYDPDNNNEYAAYTETNLYDAARFIDSYSGASPVILGGDLNTRPDQAGYRIISQLGALVDIAYHLHSEHPITFSADNPYSESDNQCLDYLMARNIGMTSIEVVMTARLSDDALAYSDHYGLLADIDVRGEKLNHYHAAISPVMRDLLVRVKQELLESEATQISSVERAIFGLASIFDGLLLSSLIGRYSKSWAKRLRWLGAIAGVIFAIIHIVQAGLNLEGRKNTLKNIEAELEKQIESKRLFDGREL